LLLLLLLPDMLDAAARALLLKYTIEENGRSGI
jgi:hypothetical protein